MAGRSSEKLNERLLAALTARDGLKASAILDALTGTIGQPAHASLLRLLTHLLVPESEARAILLAAFGHREALQEKLGRDVGVRTALFDLLIGVEKRVPNPKIIDLPTFEKIERSAITDHLTGLYNRSHFDERLLREVRRAIRFGQYLSLLIVDIDDFKRINDTQGHLVGDLVLRDVGRLIVEGIRDIDIAARYGGEEFAIILPETRRQGAYIVAERIRAIVQSHFSRRHGYERAFKATLSGGLAVLPEDAEGPEGLVSRADEALYRAKHAGKNLINVYYEEKRKSARIDIEERRLKALLVEEGGRERVRHAGHVKNVSVGGLLVEVADPVPVGTELQVYFTLGMNAAQKLPCKVVRLDEYSGNGRRRRYELGLRFQKRSRSLLPQLSRLTRRTAAAG